MSKESKEAEKVARDMDAALRILRKHIENGDKIYGASRPGCQTYVSVFCVGREYADREIVEISSFVARAIGRKYDPDRGGVHMPGTGDYRLSEIACDLSQALFGNPHQIGYDRLSV